MRVKVPGVFYKSYKFKRMGCLVFLNEIETRKAYCLFKACIFYLKKLNQVRKGLSPYRLKLNYKALTSVLQLQVLKRIDFEHLRKPLHDNSNTSKKL